MGVRPRSLQKNGEKNFYASEANDWLMSGQGSIHQLPSWTFTGRNEGEGAKNARNPPCRASRSVFRKFMMLLNTANIM
ncbi:hypothetical protein OAF65_08765 [Verrucomicrobiales bacterium]|nr:hypothetical protein [Verrucomicrobiales bacterium]